jgi:hypothetical protein
MTAQTRLPGAFPPGQLAGATNRCRPERVRSTKHGRPFPARTVRDLIGVARLMYRALASASVRDGRLPELVGLGRDLQQALAMARDSKPWTQQQHDAWQFAEIATRRLCRIAEPLGVKHLIESAFDHVGKVGVAKARRR